VDHPGWKQILQTKESKLMHDFRYRFPDMGISGISIVLCKPGANKEQIEVIKDKGKVKREEKGESYGVGAVAEAQVTQYGAIKDEALKEVLMRLEKYIAEKEK
jgi:hypothetical protein